jgi:hypothetical protein
MYTHMPGKQRLTLSRTAGLRSKACVSLRRANKLHQHSVAERETESGTVTYIDREREQEGSEQKVEEKRKDNTEQESIRKTRR